MKRMRPNRGLITLNALILGTTAGALVAGGEYPNEFRTIDGTLNNEDNPEWGAVNAPLVRMTPIGYEGGSWMPAGPDRPSARLVSNLVCAQTGVIDNEAGASNFLWQWGQFIDHDITLVPFADPVESFDIEVPQWDPWFDPDGDGDVIIPLERSDYVMDGDDVRQQYNINTAYIDASQVYGSDEPRSEELRTMDETGRLKMSAGDLLPFNVNGFFNFPVDDDPSFFLAGDVRANEQSGLTCMHTLFVREHNYWAGRILEDDPKLSGDDVYLRARAVVAAEIQAITYREFLPVLLGPDAIDPYDQYQPGENAGIANIFATAGYRVGHTLLPTELARLDQFGHVMPGGPLDLAQAFFAPAIIIDDGIDPLLRGLAQARAQEIDELIIDDVRNFLFGPPGAGGFDLPSLNLQRGRDHGLASYNEVRVAFGRPAATGFEDIHPDPDVHSKFAATYDDIDDVDPWVGLLAEPHRPGAMVGETLYRVLRDQFTRFRDGDRFWYGAYLPESMVGMVEQQTLSRIIRRNADIAGELQRNVFFVTAPCTSDADQSGAVDVEDLIAVLEGWGACDFCDVDIDADDLVGVTDLLEVLEHWGPCRDRP